MRLALAIALELAIPALAQAAPVTLDCALAPGTGITAFAASGALGNAVKWTVPTKSRDFVFSGSILTVAPGGISDCGKTNTITVSGTFTYTVSAPAIPSLVADDNTTGLQADDSATPLMGQ